MAATTYTGTRNGDRLSARTSSDTLEGLGGNDILSSGTTALSGVKLFGGDGNDTLIAKDSDALIDGGLGLDTVQFSAEVTTGLLDDELVGVEKVQITNTATAAYSFANQSEALDITGGRAADYITGGSGNDTLTGGLGADTLIGGNGDDVIVAESGDATIDGGGGTDTVRFAAGVALHTGLSANVWLNSIDRVEITNTGNAAYDFSDQTEALNIQGGRGRDTITGGAAADTLSGGNGNDELIAQASDALIDGGAGNDTVKYDAAVGTSSEGLSNAALTNVEYVVITNTAAAVYNFSSQTEGLDIAGNTGADSIHGGSGADALRGGLGNDALYAGDNDKLIDGGNGADDIAYFAASVSAKNLLDADLINVEVIGITGTGSYDFSAQSEKLVITATGGAVTITGGKGVDTLTGGTGNDVIVASDLDVINGGGGDDTVRFAAAVSAANLIDGDLLGVNNIIITNTKAATYDFSEQTERLNITGNSGNDTIKTATGTADTINAGAGNDVLVAEEGDALIDGGTGIDTVQFAAGVSSGLADAELANVEYVVITNTGNATYDFSVQTESLQITGNSANDIIKGGYRADTITGGGGNDQLLGGNGADLLIAESGDTLIDGGDGDDTVRFAAAVAGLLDAGLVNIENVVITNMGNAAYDFSDQGTTVGVTENLNITSGSGNDTITGGADADTLSGGAGNDVLVAQATDALIDGGAGADTVKFGADVSTALTNAELVNVERVEITNTSTTLAGTYNFSAQTEELTIIGSDYFVATAGATQYDSDTITGGSGNDSISGGNGDDLLTGGAGADTLLGGDLSDTLVGGLGVDSLLGGDGDDRLEAQDTDAKIDGGANTQVSGASGGDTALFDTGVSAVNLSNAKLVEIERVLITNEAAASYDFSAQTEALIITGGGVADTITGTQDWDSIDGAAGNDVLSGGAGNDSLKGNAGNDTLTGGAGMDVYQVDSGTDTITDLVAGETLTVSSGATAVVASGLLDLTQLVTTSNLGTVNITGTLSADVIKGTATVGGVDVITGGVGADTMSGIGGSDRFVIAAGDSVFTNGTTAQSNSAALDKVIDFSGDLIVISGPITDTTFSVAANVFVGTGAGGADDNQDNVNDFVNTTYLVDLDGTVTTFELGLDVTTNGTAAAFASSAAARAATILNVTGTTGNDTITGGVNADTILGGEGADVIAGGAGADVLSGGIGNDTFVVAGTANIALGESYDGGADSDTLSVTSDTNFTGVASLTSIEAITLAAGVDATFDLALLSGKSIVINGTGDNGGETLTFQGTSGADAIDLSASALTLSGLVIDANDILSVAFNGAGDIDTITGTAGNDTISGGAGADVISGGDGVDTYLLANGDSIFSAFDTVMVTDGDKVRGGGLGSGNAVLASGGAQALTDLVTNSDLATALEQVIGAGLANNTFIVWIGDSQATSGVNYAGYYLVSEFSGTTVDVDSFDIVVKLVGVSGTSSIAFSGNDIVVTL